MGSNTSVMFIVYTSLLPTTPKKKEKRKKNKKKTCAKVTPLMMAFSTLEGGTEGLCQSHTDWIGLESQVIQSDGPPVELRRIK